MCGRGLAEVSFRGGAETQPVTCTQPEMHAVVVTECSWSTAFDRDAGFAEESREALEKLNVVVFVMQIVNAMHVPPDMMAQCVSILRWFSESGTYPGCVLVHMQKDSSGWLGCFSGGARLIRWMVRNRNAGDSAGPARCDPNVAADLP